VIFTLEIGNNLFWILTTGAAVLLVFGWWSFRTRSRYDR